MNKKDSWGDIFFEDIKTIRYSRFSHYLIEKETILELNSMKAIYCGLREINDMLDKDSWGIFYPIYQAYRKLRYGYIKFKHERKYPNLKRLRE